MATIEQVERLREKTNVSYTEAKEALEKCGDDLLDAILYLEEQGKVKTPENEGKYSSHNMPGGKDYEMENKKHKYHGYRDKCESGEGFHKNCHQFWGWCKKMLKKGCVNTFEAYRYGENVFKMPVIVFIVLLVFAFWVTVPLLVVGLFFGFKYLFGGPDLADTDLNKAMDAASGAAENVKSEIKTAAENHENHNNK